MMMKLTKEQLPPRYTKNLANPEDVGNVTYYFNYESDYINLSIMVYDNRVDDLFRDSNDTDYPELQKAANARLVRVLSTVSEELGKCKVTEPKERTDEEEELGYVDYTRDYTECKERIEAHLINLLTQK